MNGTILSPKIGWARSLRPHGSRVLRPAPAWARLRPYSAAVPAGSPPLRKTPLYDFHLARGAKMVPFADHHMPVSYGSLRLADSHLFTRTEASLFDVSHMVQHRFSGPDAAAFLETVCPSGVVSLGHMRSTLTTFLWPVTGGIVDDAVITRLGDDEYHVVTNGACRDKDMKYFDEQLAEFRAKSGGGRLVRWTPYQAGLLALQGPRSAEILHETLADKSLDLRAVLFGGAVQAPLMLRDGTATAPLLLSRGGYTGEDGFEIALPPSRTLVADTTALAETLLSVAGPSRLQLAGLGVRDSLRLEAGMCLYGHDLDDTTTPVEAGLSWIIPPERRLQGDFLGSDVILGQLVPRSKGGRGVERRRVGIVLDEDGRPRPAAREGAEIRAAPQRAGDPVVIGTVTSGMPSPTLKRSIAMGYVADGHHKVGTRVEVMVRGQPRMAVVTKMPFVQTRYWKG